uniref:Uncharacterized protein n=1 Tax=Anguilla anguilla TaxID=7936 RepID=A0A0E9PNC4_ANGAN
MGTDCNLSAACHSSLTWEIGSPFSISVPNSCLSNRTDKASCYINTNGAS